MPFACKMTIIGITALSLAGLAGCWEDPGKQQSNRDSVDPPPHVILASPTGNDMLGDPELVQARLRFEPESLVVKGVDQCVGSRVETVTLVNYGDTDETVERSITSCGCASLGIDPGTVIPAGGRVSVPVILKPWGESRRKVQDARLMVAEGRLGPMLHLDVEITSTLRTIPSACQRALHEDGMIRIIGNDEAPFSLLGVDPEIPYSTLETDGVEVSIFIEWDKLDAWARTPEARADPRIKFDDEGEWDRFSLTILTSSPDCPRLGIEVFNRNYTKPTWH